MSDATNTAAFYSGRNAKLMAERDRYKAALEDALEGLDEMLPYVDVYYVAKWDLAKYAERVRRVLVVS